MSDASAAEFDTVAQWTAQVAAELGPDYYVPAGCRGSGSPAGLDWLVERMGLGVGGLMLDCGAGVGGPVAYAVQATSIAPVLIEPEAGACWAAKRLFGYPVIRASGSALPVGDGAVDAAWSLGVLCTTDEQTAMLAELRRVVRADGPIGLLVFVAHGDIPHQLQDNTFPTDDQLLQRIDDSSLRVVHRTGTADLPAAPASWNRRVDEVTALLADRHGDTDAWQLAERQSTTFGALLDDGVLSGELLVLRSV